MCLICDDVGCDMIFELCCLDFPSCWFGFKESSGAIGTFPSMILNRKASRRCLLLSRSGWSFSFASISVMLPGVLVW